MPNEIALNGTYRKVEIRPYKHRVRYHELDTQGIVHPSHYMNWIENARLNLLEQIGLGLKQMENMEILMPVLSNSIEYHSPIKFDDTIVIDTKVTSYDGKQIEVAYRIFDEKTGEDYAMAKSKHFFANKSGIPISLGRIYPELDTTFFEMK